jgi:hypothetical protein
MKGSRDKGAEISRGFRTEGVDGTCNSRDQGTYRGCEMICSNAVCSQENICAQQGRQTIFDRCTAIHALLSGSKL